MRDYNENSSGMSNYTINQERQIVIETNQKCNIKFERNHEYLIKLGLNW